MEEVSFGPVRFIPGENKGKYPFCHSIYIDGAGVLIDPASDRERLMRLKKESGVKAVWLTHWHEDHIAHLDLFDDVPLFISEQDAPMLSDLEIFLDAYGLEDETYRNAWRTIMTTQFNFRPRKPAGYFKDNQTIDLGIETVEVLHTPGHTPGHLAFHFLKSEVLFLGDYDLTKFGPWYGDRDSVIEDTIISVRRLKKIPAKAWVACHEEGVFQQNPGDAWDQYLEVIEKREQKLLEFLAEPRTLKDIINKWIVYGKPREPAEFYAFAEQALISKHIENLIKQMKIISVNGRFMQKPTGLGHS